MLLCSAETALTCSRELNHTGIAVDHPTGSSRNGTCMNKAGLEAGVSQLATKYEPCGQPGCHHKWHATQMRKAICIHLSLKEKLPSPYLSHKSIRAAVLHPQDLSPPAPTSEHKASLASQDFFLLNRANLKSFHPSRGQD